MCRVIAIRQVEECLDGTTIKEFELAAPMTEATMRRIAQEGKLQYFPDFSTPVFPHRPNRCVHHSGRHRSVLVSSCFRSIDN